VNELGFQTERDRPARVGCSPRPYRRPLLNGFINYEFWMAVPKVQFRGVADLICAAKRGRRQKESICQDTPWLVGGMLSFR
jgi:hypothetical protein